MEGAAPKTRSEFRTMLAANKCSQVISKSYSAAKDEGRSRKYSHHNNIVSPKVRIVYVYEPKIIKTDPESFRFLVQRLTGKSSHRSKEKNRRRKDKSPSSEIIAAEVGTENLEYTFDINDQVSIMQKETTKFPTEDFSGFSKGFSDTDMISPTMMNHGLLDEISLIPSSLVNQGYSSANNLRRLLDQKSTHKSKEKKQTNDNDLSFEVIDAEVGTENLEYTCYRTEQLPIMENKTKKFSAEDCTGFSKGFNGPDMIFPSLMDQRLLDEIPLVWNNSIFCNMYDDTGVYKWD